MNNMKIYNSLTRKIEEFRPIKKGKVGIYTCGPTIYDYATIGNWRTYVLSDLLVRVLKAQGYDVNHIMNLTDVGHLSGDNEGDADTGEDRMEKGAKREGKNAWDIAKYYGEIFLEEYRKLNMLPAQKFPKASDHIDEQIDLIKKLEEKGFTYKIKDGIYFDTKEYEKKTGRKYGELSSLDKIKEGARVEKNKEKKDAQDFALWKFSYQNGRGPTSHEASKGRHMEWESPWGVGFPGWHAECSAMAMKYLGESFDIHVGGEDLRSTHHPNEIAQSEGMTGKKFVNYWMHGVFLKVDGKRMGKSLGNAYTLQDIEKKGIDLLALRYFYLTGHYRKPLNFTWEALESAALAFKKLQSLVADLRNGEGAERTKLSSEKLAKIDEYNGRFMDAVLDDLNMPKGLAILWSVIKSNIPTGDKYDLILNFDEILGLNLSQIRNDKFEVPSNIEALKIKREDFRDKGKYEEGDKIRLEIEEKGYTVKDTEKGSVLTKK